MVVTIRSIDPYARGHVLISVQGTCPFDAIIPPLTSLGGPDGAGQMQHFVTDDNMNIFRLRKLSLLLLPPPHPIPRGRKYLTLPHSCIMAIPPQQQAGWQA